MVNNNKIQSFSTELLLRISDIIVKKFVKNGSVNYNDFEDVKQSIIEKYLLKKDKIEASFTGASKPETYISAVLYRMVLEVLRSKKNKANINFSFEDNLKIFEKEKVINPEEQLIIKNEKIYFKRVLLTLGKEQIKITLFLKFYFRLLIILIDLRSYIPKTFTEKALEILSHNENIKDKEVYFKLCEVQNLCESKKIKPDAVRMYINKNTEKIINRLNGNNRAFYTKDSLSIIFEMCYN